jgi:hypothetical protein
MSDAVATRHLLEITENHRKFCRRFNEIRGKIVENSFGVLLTMIWDISIIINVRIVAFTLVYLQRTVRAFSSVGRATDS